MTPVDDELRDLLRERATPPEAPPDRYESVRRQARVRHRRRLAATFAATGLAVAAVLAVPLALLSDRDPTVPAVPAQPWHPPAAELTPVNDVVATGQEIKVGLSRGACDREATGVAWLQAGNWHLAVWTVDDQSAGDRVCSAVAIGYTLRLPLSEPYGGQPVTDAATGDPVKVNGGPGFVVPTYLPADYSLSPGTKGGLTLAGPQGGIILQEGEPDVGTVEDYPGWPYDVLDRPDIAGHQGMLIRYRNDGDNTVLRWTDGERGFSLQVFSATLDPQELVKIARSMQ
jgi:hypothetical protein